MYKNEVIVFGASGDLAKRKIYPAMHSLYVNNKVNTRIIGYGRTPMSQTSFHKHITSMIPHHDISSNFTEICSYVNGPYNNFNTLKNDLKSSNRLFYLSIPSTIYNDVITNISTLFSKDGWNRVLIEKPIGQNLDTFYALQKTLLNHVPEADIFCVDHYLGKMVLTQLPRIQQSYKHIWNSTNIKHVDICFSEKKGIEEREYFDDFGIIRDVVQNHLLQVCAIVLGHKQKLKNIHVSSATFGQYQGYHDSKFVKRGSKTPTFFKGTLHITDGVWNNVPVTIKAGKALDSDKVEVILTLRDDKLIYIRIQPDPVIHIDNEVHEFNNINAYEIVLQKAIEGKKDAFVSLEEIEDSWKILDNVLDNDSEPFIYKPGAKLM